MQKNSLETRARTLLEHTEEEREGHGNRRYFRLTILNDNTEAGQNFSGSIGMSSDVCGRRERRSRLFLALSDFVKKATVQDHGWTFFAARKALEKNGV